MNTVEGSVSSEFGSNISGQLKSRTHLSTTIAPLVSGISTYLACLGGLKLLQLALEAQVGAGTRASHLHGRQGLLPA